MVSFALEEIKIKSRGGVGIESAMVGSHPAVEKAYPLHDGLHNSRTWSY
jgi:hypothetical protein